MKLFCVALVAGATAIVEHPSESETQPHEVAIWHTAIVRVLMRFPRCKRQKILQGHFGAKSTKPTTLLLANCTDSAEQLFLDDARQHCRRKLASAKTQKGDGRQQV